MPKIRMSEALRTSQYSQVRGELMLRADPYGKVTGMCALGQIYERIFDELPALGTITPDIRGMLEEAGYPTYHMALHPVTGWEAGIGEIIEDLNDAEGWTSEEIADWLEKEEERIAHG